jgi:TetR/AcrR family transcriptional repressor of bet genes
MLVEWNGHDGMVQTIDWLYNQSMGRRSVREQRRAQITEAFARVLAAHGYAGATIAAVAAEAGVAPGLVHHHFADKTDLLASLLKDLMDRFRRRTRAIEASADPLVAYGAAAVRLDDTADAIAARCWVGVLAEAVRDPALFAQVRRLVDSEIEVIRRRSSGRFSPQDAGAVLAFVVGALVLGAFAPRKTAGFAAPALQGLIESLEARASAPRR